MNERLNIMTPYDSECPRCGDRLYQSDEDEPKCLVCGYVVYDFKGPKTKVRADKWAAIREVALKRHPMYKAGMGIWANRKRKQEREQSNG